MIRAKQMILGVVATVAAAGAAASRAPGLATHAASAQAGAPATSVASGDAPAAPHLLSQTGLYGSDGSIGPRNLPFAPQYPLWSDGAAKSRWIQLPEGTAIDVSNIDVWRFPVGTKFWKEFAWGGRKVETRMIWKAGGRAWVFATYVWNEDQSDAAHAPEAGIMNVAEIAPGKRHSIPGTGDCLACHGGSPAVVLGFTALQLSDDRDPLAPHADPLAPGMATLRSLAEAGRLDPPREDLVSRPPRIRANDPVERAAIGYLSANCGGCHNGAGPLAHVGLDLLHDAAGGRGAPEHALRTAVGARGRYIVPGTSPDSSRIVAPGAPERSAIVQRMRSRRPSSQMPPLGTVIVDDEAVELVSRWVAGMRAPAADGGVTAQGMP